MIKDYDLWAEIPVHQFSAFLTRLELVETLVDDAIADKRELKREYRRDYHVSDRTIRGYVHKYRKKGAAGLLFWRASTTILHSSFDSKV